MKINHLPVGTRLMWDAPANEWIDPDKPFTYPAIITEKHHNKQWVKIKTGNKSSWMGPEEEYLRWPNQKELETLLWPDLI